MPWQPSDREQLRRVLSLPATAIALKQIQDAMDRVELESPDTVETIQELLTEWGTQKTALKATQSTADFGLIRKKTDVIEREWAAGATQSSGIESRLGQIQQEIDAALFPKPQNSYDDFGGGYLARS